MMSDYTLADRVRGHFARFACFALPNAIRFLRKIHCWSSARPDGMVLDPLKRWRCLCDAGMGMLKGKRGGSCRGC
jgi:hypothetical protein